MPDIAMCANDDCPMAKKCHRHEAVSKGSGQVYADFEPNEHGICIAFVGTLPVAEPPLASINGGTGPSVSETKDG